jgi:hypothetical protein
MSSGNQRNDEGASQEQQQPHGEGSDAGHSGEGAASALAHMKSQNRQRRSNEGEDGGSVTQ